MTASEKREIVTRIREDVREYRQSQGLDPGFAGYCVYASLFGSALMTHKLGMRAIQITQGDK